MRFVKCISRYRTISDHFNNHPPLFIIGAARSGTTLLFEILKSQQFVTALFEPHHIWSSILGRSEDDSYPGQISFYNRLKFRCSYFDLLQSEHPVLVVKDPRDSLRVCHIDKIFPSARYIFIFRDGRDVIASVMKTSKMPVYKDDEGWFHVRIPGYKSLLTEPTHIVAAKQWSYCVRKSLKDLELINNSSILMVKYEDLITNPEHTSRNILAFAFDKFSIRDSESVIHKISNSVLHSNKVVQDTDNTDWEHQIRSVSDKTIDDAGSGTMSEGRRLGKWKSEIDANKQKECFIHIEKELELLGYI